MRLIYLKRNISKVEKNVVFILFQDYLPSNRSAIVIEDFEDVEDLAQYILLLDSNDRLYKQYLTFKDEPLLNKKLKTILDSRDWVPDFCSEAKLTNKIKNKHPQLKYNSVFTGYECFLCEKAHEYIKSGSKIRFQANSTDYRCPSPRRFDTNGRYSIHNEAWSAEWNYGKHEADAMIILHNTNRTMTQKEFYKFVKMTMKTMPEL